MIIAFIGGIGSGKTLSMTRYALEEYKRGKTIFTNYRLEFPKDRLYGKVVKLDMKFFEDYTQSKFELINSVILIDEAHVFFDSRNAMLKKNKIFSKFVTQSRKRSVDLLYTTQDISPEIFKLSGQVELRLRKLTDYIIFCEKYKEKNIVFIKQHVYDSALYERYADIFYGQSFYQYYDTNEIVSLDLD